LAPINEPIRRQLRDGLVSQGCSPHGIDPASENGGRDDGRSAPGRETLESDVVADDQESPNRFRELQNSIVLPVFGIGN